MSEHVYFVSVNLAVTSHRPLKDEEVAELTVARLEEMLEDDRADVVQSVEVCGEEG